MHLIHDENGNVIAHSHGEEQGGCSCGCGHDHEHTHSHEHTHGDGHSHSHEHSHSHGEGHDHSHSHGDCGCGHSHEGCDCKDRDPKSEIVALLTYMVQHNEHHALELDQMADNLEKAGMADAAKTIKEGVADFQKANLRFNLALAQVKAQTEEA